MLAALGMLILSLILVAVYFGALQNVLQRYRTWRWRRQFFAAERQKLENVAVWFDETHGAEQ